MENMAEDYQAFVAKFVTHIIYVHIARSFICTLFISGIQAPARTPFGDSLRPSDWLREKYRPPIGYHVNVLDFDWLP